MRLWLKIVLAMSVAILLLAMVAARSLNAMKDLVLVTQEVATQTVPALRLEEALRESIASLNRLAARYAVLRDPQYAGLWADRAVQTGRQLELLHDLLSTKEEQALYRKLTAALLAYRVLAAPGFAAAGEPKAPAVAGSPQLRAAERAERSVLRLMAATHRAVEHAEAVAHKLAGRTWRSVMIVLPVGMLAALLGASVLAFGMTRALGRLSAATREVARGSFAGPVAVESRDEIGELAEAFNRMAERLGEVDRLKQEFFAHISHELRTPLTAVREATHLLSDRIPGPLEPKQARLVEIIGANTERVLRLVNRILELARLRAGLLEVDRRPVDLEKLAARALEELRPQAETRGVRLELAGTGRGPIVAGDPDRLLEVLVNLIGNAVKFTSAEGAVRVAVVDRGEEVEVTVEDTGVGMSAEALRHVFEPYWQAPGARGGTGLGLAIVKGVVEAHGGRVSAQARPGQGSRFTVRLPRSARAAA